ncbi:hypothetical protein EI546_10665 [Aequorivita sp. H23M31]|uniref:Outer membrane protein beta-barrel domain-containing protein n=1 Tax=Aequorivita ciconiae TaxID=2494375 RepID=A0A410G4H8_9FLAO|nr:outer membrane beta-barrel protein [Aequorivita sp. H23M31]QAA82156.1 hypothetical protein EI546_10665 [Aequorivita sp. H23M31]
MEQKKNIDELFKEAFKNMEATPSPRVWENIQAKLKKEKRSRKIIPLWIKYGGIAALLALLFTIGNSVFNPNDPITNAITNENIIDSVEGIDGNEDIIKSKVPEAPIASEQEDIPQNSTPNNKENVIDFSNDKREKSSIEKTSKTAIASSVSDDNSKSLESDKEKHTNKHNDKTAISKAETNLAVNENEKTDNYIESEKVVEPFRRKEGEMLKDAEERIAITEGVNENSSVHEIKGDSINKKSLLDVIAENEKADKQENSEFENPTPRRRWMVTPNVAPVYYSSLGNGSSIAPDFTDNPQKGDVNMSYGLQVSYALSERLSLRTGMSNVDLSYSTSDIIIGTGPVSLALSSVDYGSRQIVVTAISKNSLTNGNAPSNEFGEISTKSSGSDARLIQNLSYFEVPLELKYAVIDNRFGINLIGGISTLFLGNNEISVKSDNFSSVLGPANNLSDVSFSTNIGLGLDYKLSKAFVFNIEPMFKYQLNPYTDSSVNFKPYYLGVYSGLSFKF